MIGDDPVKGLGAARSATLQIGVDRLQHNGVHRDSFAFGRFAQLGGLLVGKPQGHGHMPMISG